MQGDRIQFVIQIIDFSLDILNRQLLMQNKLENEIRGWVCHEINNALNSNEGSIQLIQLSIDQLNDIQCTRTNDCFEEKKVEIDEEVTDLIKHVEILGASTRLMRNFVRDLLDFQAIKENRINIDVAEFDLADAVEEVIQMQRKNALMRDISI